MSVAFTIIMWTAVNRPAGASQPTAPATTLCGITNSSSITYGSGSAPMGNPFVDAGGETTYSNTLGTGAGLSTPEPGNYFAPGTTPQVSATFTAAWAAQAPQLSLAYSIASSTQAVANSWPAPTTVSLSQATTVSGGGLSLPLPIPSADTGAGVYVVNADLQNSSTGAVQGTTCLEYSVGMAGDTIDLHSIMAYETTSYGPFPERGVVLASELGTGSYRTQLAMATLLPNCNSASVTIATCGPGALTYGAYDSDYQQASVLASQLGVTFEVQVGQGQPVENAIVNYDMANGYGANNANNLWQQDVTAIVEHFATSAPDLSDFEAWNEPNNTWSPGATSYVANILVPFWDGVQQANATTGRADQVLGGTVCGTDLPYWQSIAAAGGFSDMNIVSTHPYTGYDASYEEQGVPAFFASLKSLMAANGAGAMPIWDTEQGWWSDGFATFWDVGNFAARAWMWNKSFGITNWDYYTEEGQSMGGQPSYSLVELTYGDDFIKPAGIALATAANVLGQRPYLGPVTTGIPHTYGMLFGSAPGTSNDVEALWSDDLTVPAQLTLSQGSGTAAIPVTGVLGQSGTLSVSAGVQTPVTLSGAPQYLTVPAGDAVTVSAPEPFGPDLATASGVTTTASSNASAASLVVRTSTSNGTSVPDASNDEGANYGGWSAAGGDATPSVTVNFPAPQSVDRVVVSTTSLGSVLAGLRNYQVQLDEGGTWTTVATQSDQLQQRMAAFSFPTATASGVRIAVGASDFGSEAGGLAPWYWSSSFPQQASVYSVEAYAPGSATTPAPTVSSLSPASGPSAGGTAVTITGTGFGGATQVLFGTAAASAFSVTSATSITATAPPGSAGSVDVTVTTPGGTSATSSADRFTYDAAPTVTGLSPASGPSAGGTAVTITGTGFGGATQVLFGTAAASAFSVTSA
ncbi:MAG TPA: IPT/TIG domain-containing protein, partial [Acidimicrobiales bacterium]|nr:IPT/TIG domain-containing protein [Acidimicrobiales bacterium]